MLGSATSFEPATESEGFPSAGGQTPFAPRVPANLQTLRRQLKQRVPNDTTIGVGSNGGTALRATHGTANISQHSMVPWLTNRSERRRRAALGIPILEHATMLNRWQGQVQEVSEDSFSAVLFDLNRPELTEFARFSFNEISDEDMGFLRPGSVFYWYILLHITPQGKRKRETWIWFRRAGRMTREAYEQSLQKVKDEWRAFEGDNSVSQTTGTG